MAKKIAKTNALRLLDAAKIAYSIHNYSIDDDLIDGASVYKKLGLPSEAFFKTLIARGKSKEIYVFVVPVLAALDLKKAAKAASEKSIELTAMKELLTLTGYIRGGCSPVGMKKHYQTFFDHSIDTLEKVYVSAGKKGILMELTPNDLIRITEGKSIALCTN
ncbi:Cys-tRNA(Pro)/Cys-tRNA(Cys) deacylase [Pustulibacterium marinum]|uniref:Cys-tRNA(Pro)/Cys-tRNA(Cys) deacylase n=1 Tax=Pustulibacterium marinum TaxID=1224947 RepID=A0A1I7IUQ9_9FLAO|nr:Cys-tRNA(Pro) deacylase [Pustulibacterium marinum]SFU76622.1 Cys-tRNA(Pro)/Cys-tRNA(Cys) deacylase [Pustulibacterium marinum]